MVEESYNLSILFFMSFSLKLRDGMTCLQQLMKTLNPLFHELFSETNFAPDTSSSPVNRKS